MGKVKKLTPTQQKVVDARITDARVNGYTKGALDEQEILAGRIDAVKSRERILLRIEEIATHVAHLTDATSHAILSITRALDKAMG